MKNNINEKFFSIRIGGSRITLLIGFYAIKFAYPIIFFRRFCYGCISNIEEQYIWKTKEHRHYTEKQIIQYFNPTLYCSVFGLFTIQPRLLIRETNVIGKTDYERYLLNSCEEFWSHNIGHKLNNDYFLSFDYGLRPLTKRKTNRLKKIASKFGVYNWSSTK